MKIKVLHIIPGFLYGGIESRLIDWYSSIDRDVIQFDVLKVTQDKSNPNVNAITSMGGNVLTVTPLGGRTWHLHEKEIETIIRNGQYNIIHCHSPIYAYFSLKIAKKYGIRTRILHARTSSYGTNDKAIFFKKILAKLSLHYVTNRFACSQEAAHWAFGSDKDVTIIPNGVHVNSFQFDKEKRSYLRKKLGIEDCDYVLGFVGRFTEPKNLPFLIEVFSKLSINMEKVKLVLIGDGPMYQIVLKIINDKCIEDKTILLGRRENINELINVFDIFCLPSLYEGFPGVAVEAQANGLPCLLSDRITHSTKIIESLDFLSIDSIDVWVEQLKKRRWERRTPNATSLIKEAGYDIESTAKKLEDFYLKNSIKM